MLFVYNNSCYNELNITPLEASGTEPLSPRVKSWPTSCFINICVFFKSLVSVVLAARWLWVNEWVSKSGQRHSMYKRLSVLCL